MQLSGELMIMVPLPRGGSQHLRLGYKYLDTNAVIQILGYKCLDTNAAIQNL